MKGKIMNSAKSQGLPWVEKYRPDKLDELIAHEDIIRTITCFMKEDRLPHLLFYGPPGTGKTSTILACAKQMYGHKQFPAMVLELNASDDRGIGVVREQIYSFASTRSMFNSGFKLVILDEADAMTQDAQNALRRVIEKFTKNTRFCLICNYLTKIIPAIQSRCTRFRFGPLSNKQIIPRLQYVIKEEKLNVTPDGEKALVDLAQGDMRKVLNVLQCAALAFEEVNEVNVYTCVGHPLKSDIKCIVNWLLNDNFLTASKNIRNMQTSKGLALQDIITQVHLYVHRIDLPANTKIHLLVKMSDIEDHLAYGTNEKIQLSALIAAFQVARDMVP